MCPVRLGQSGLLHLTDGLAAEVDKLNGGVGIVIAVVHLVGPEEIFLHSVQVRLIHQTGGNFHLELVVLSHVPHLGHVVELAPLLRDVFRGQPPAALLHQRQNRLVNLLGRRLVVGDEGGFHIALFDVCRQQTPGRTERRGGWDEHRVDAHLLGQVDGVEGTAPP